MDVRGTSIVIKWMPRKLFEPDGTQEATEPITDAARQLGGLDIPVSYCNCGNS